MSTWAPPGKGADHSRTFQRSLRDCGMAGVSIDRYEVSGVTKML
ncbi:MAG: hypothetical protein Ct9H300mP12_06480 [Acidimicrobiales bacterium]|nr:MAG: hypothetical protein Ct9H300mP12_06480 [Acidimicrobiales bacterium]